MAEDNQLLNKHKQTWKGFVRLITVSSAIIVIALILMAAFLL
jgi:hypothetical protein